MLNDPYVLLRTDENGKKAAYSYTLFPLIISLTDYFLWDRRMIIKPKYCNWLSSDICTGFVPQIVIIEYNQLLHFGLIEWFVDLIKNVLYMINMTTVIFKHFRPPIFMDSFA